MDLSFESVIGKKIIEQRENWEEGVYWNIQDLN